MNVPRLTFLSHFIICLACAALAFFALMNDVPRTIWANDQSYMTSVIGALFAGSAVYLAWRAWLVDDVLARHLDGASKRVLHIDDIGSAYGHLAERTAAPSGSGSPISCSASSA